MNILAQSCDHADFRKLVSENCEEITLSLYNNNLAVIGPNSGTKL